MRPGVVMVRFLGDKDVSRTYNLSIFDCSVEAAEGRNASALSLLESDSCVVQDASTSCDVLFRF
jgi:hypothetical protein